MWIKNSDLVGGGFLPAIFFGDDIIKKFFKGFFLVLLAFMIFLYFLGSCMERPEEYKPSSESVAPAYTELTPDEYQRQMDELIKKPPVTTKTAFKSPVLQAHAESLLDKLYEFYDKTGLYGIDDFVDDWFTGYYTLKDYVSGNDSYPVVSADSETPEEPKESVTVPFQYEFYGKNRVVYGNGTYEVIECRLITSEARSDKKKTGVVRYTRTNQYHSTTSFSFDISVSNIKRNFSSGSAFVVDYYGLESYTNGLTQDFIENYLKNSHSAYFLGSSSNSLRQFNVSGTSAVRILEICYNKLVNSYPNVFSISTTLTNDYEFSQSLTNYYVNNNYWRFPNIYYNNHAGDIITQNNVTNYNDYGYTYNSITNSIEFDPNVFADFFDLNVKPKLQLEFDDIFSKFPDIDAVFGDLDVEFNNMIDIMNEINNTPATTTGTYPVGTGNGGCDCDIYVTVTVDVTLPEEFYKKYPTLTTEPAFVAENPDTDYAFDEPLPLEILNSSGKILTMASDIITDSGLMPMYIMCVALSLVAFFLL